MLNIEDQIDDIDTLVTNLETALRESLDSHAPEKSKVITCRPKLNKAGSAENKVKSLLNH